MKSYVPKVEVEAEAEEVEPPAKKARTKTEKAEKVDKADPMVLCKNPPCNDSSKVDAKNAAADDSNDWSKIFACNGFARHRWNGDGLFRHPENTRDASRLETNLEIKL